MKRVYELDANEVANALAEYIEKTEKIKVIPESHMAIKVNRRTQAFTVTLEIEKEI